MSKNIVGSPETWGKPFPVMQMIGPFTSYTHFPSWVLSKQVLLRLCALYASPAPPVQLIDTVC